MNRSGQIGFVVILICLLIIAFLVWRNHEAAMKMAPADSITTPEQGTNRLKNVQDEMNRIQEQQKQNLEKNLPPN